MAGKKRFGFVQRLGVIIRQERKKLGMTQKELARRSGMHAMAISKVERGVHGDLGCKTLWAIAHCLGSRGHILYALAETVTLYSDPDEV